MDTNPSEGVDEDSYLVWIQLRVHREVSQPLVSILLLLNAVGLLVYQVFHGQVVWSCLWLTYENLIRRMAQHEAMRRHRLTQIRLD